MAPSVAQALVMVDELIVCGVTDVVIGVGSRSAPLALALARGCKHHTARHEERHVQGRVIGGSKEDRVAELGERLTERAPAAGKVTVDRRRPGLAQAAAAQTPHLS